MRVGCEQGGTNTPRGGVATPARPTRLPDTSHRDVATPGRNASRRDAAAPLLLQLLRGLLGPVGEDDVGAVPVLGRFVYKFFQLSYETVAFIQMMAARFHSC